MAKAALISVSDKTGLEELARSLASAGYALLCTSGSGRYLSDRGLPVIAIEEYTGQKEILDGRVKTLHPKIHAGLLARRDSPAHMAQLEADGIFAIDVAVVNLYPFIQNLGTDKASDPSQMIELIDVGGPTMIRAAAKNAHGVLPLLDPKDYPRAIEALGSTQGISAISAKERMRLASKVFAATAAYDLEIARYLAQASSDEPTPSVRCDVGGVVLAKAQSLRYGENPHQEATFYWAAGESSRGWSQLGGKELSYNNLLDLDAATKLIRAFSGGVPTAAILKHLNPCGAAQAADALDALKKAKLCDPRSHFGGIIALNVTVTEPVANEVKEDFAEIIVAPDFTDGALAALRSRKNLRIIKLDNMGDRALELRSAAGGYLLQVPDTQISSISEARVATSRQPSREERDDLAFAWLACAHVKSNAIVIVKDRMLLGVGAGQMSRIDSVELAISKAKLHGHDLLGAVAASDAFFPFPDSVETLAAAGVKAVIAPSGAKKDEEVTAAADRAKVSLLFALDRHFRH